MKARFAAGLTAFVTVVVVLSLALPAVAAACRGGWQPANLDDQLMCPTCHVPLNQSDSRAAQDIRHFVAARCRAGWSEQRTKQALIDQFGPAILAAPPFQGFDMLAWLVPAAVLVVGAGSAAAVAWTWTRRRPLRPDLSAHSPPLDPDMVRRIDSDLRRDE